MDEENLKLAEKHIVSAYECIRRQRLLIRHLRMHRRHAAEVPRAIELLGVMEAICKQFRVHRRIVQQDVRRSDTRSG